jgi:hypothetical protein
VAPPACFGNSRDRLPARERKLTDLQRKAKHANHVSDTLRHGVVHSAFAFRRSEETSLPIRPSLDLEC